jgi:hypothetical protein
MKSLAQIIKRRGIVALTFGIMILNSFCMGFNSKMSECYYDEKAGMNGSFEIVENGFPVNWIVYSPKTIPTGDYDLIIDTTTFNDGNQSLKFFVRQCSSEGGWHSPGICIEYDVNPDETYMLSLWVKNDSCEFIVKIGSINNSIGEYKTIIKSNEIISDWKLIEYKFSIPSKMNSIRFEMNILQPGTFWIDDIKIDKISNKEVL